MMKKGKKRTTALWDGSLVDDSGVDSMTLEFERRNQPNRASTDNHSIDPRIHLQQHKEKKKKTNRNERKTEKRTDKM